MIRTRFTCLRKSLYIILCLSLLTLIAGAQGRSPLKCLGYPDSTKLLIIHADDLGMAHTEDMASLRAYEKGFVASGSIMVPCPWFSELASYAVAHPSADLGLHLTLTSEWQSYKWGPVAPATEVSSLVNELGYFYDSTLTFVQHAKPDEVEKEVRAQIARAEKAGIDFTHFDSHMFSMAATLDLAKLYIQLSHEYNVPIPINLAMAEAAYHVDIRSLLNEKDVLLDTIVMAGPADYKMGLASYYSQILKSIKPGVSLLLIHPSDKSEEMEAITIDHPDYGSDWRKQDLDFITSDRCVKMLKKLNIQLITWREIRDKCYRK